MVFSAAPLYLDPHNWHHQQHQQPLQPQQNQQLSVVTHGGGGGSGENSTHYHQIPVHTPPLVTSQVVVGGSSSSIRPGSMADRARQAKIPQPEPGLKCPRCESTNTKFCYFNNYSLTQPRHFCKSCRRYWTRGGALRNVPVGGGCRRNKRSGKSGGASKSTGGKECQIGAGPGNDNSTSPLSSNSNNTEMNTNIHGSMLDISLPSQSFGMSLTQFPIVMPSLQGLAHSQYGSHASNLGLNYGEIMSAASQGELGFQFGASVGNSSNQWRPHDFPNFLGGFDPQQTPHPPTSSSLYQFPIDHQSMRSVRSSMLSINSSDHKDNEADAVKAEGASQGGMSLLPRSYLGMSENSQYWVGNSNNNNNSTWTDQSGLKSSTPNIQ